MPGHLLRCAVVPSGLLLLSNRNSPSLPISAFIVIIKLSFLQLAATLTFGPKKLGTLKALPHIRPCDTKPDVSCCQSDAECYASIRHSLSATNPQLDNTSTSEQVQSDMPPHPPKPPSVLMTPCVTDVSSNVHAGH